MRADRQALVSAARAAAWAAIAAVVLLALRYIMIAPERCQWDMKAYYYAAKAYALGLNPYDVANVRQLSGDPQCPRYLYPLTVLLLLRPFVSIPYHTFYCAYLALKVAALVALVAIWRWWFGRRIDPLVFAAVVVFGYGSAALFELRCGNRISVEHLLMWAGFAGFVVGREWLFAAMLTAASIFTVTPIAFLGLLFLPRPKSARPFVIVAVAVVALAAVAGLPFLSHPDWLATFAQAAARTVEPTWTNPCTRTVFIKLLSLPGLHKLPHRDALALGGWAAFAITVLAISLPKLRAIANDRKALVLASTIIYALVMPRFKIYSYVLLLPATLHIIGHSSMPLWAALLALVILAVPNKGTILEDFQGLEGWFLLVFFWAMWLAGYVRFATHRPDGGAQESANSTSPPGSGE